MQNHPKPADLVARLKDTSYFAEVDEATLQWLIDQSDYLLIPKGEFLFHNGDKVDHMQVLLEGKLLLRREKDGRKREVGVWEAPSVTGVLPFSRMTTVAAEGIALEDLYFLQTHRDCFTEMVNRSYCMVQSLVSVMTERVRDFQQIRLMDEKLMALGKMSAGLAHELNNPASAMVRSSRELHRHLTQTPERFKALVTMRVDPDTVDEINAVLFERIANHGDPDELSLLEREERNDDL
ncbi:MAG: cyclic nucleotide-binding domain-containing protein, partial [Bacteroidota bacterium]